MSSHQNTFFNNFQNKDEQNLIDDLIVESIGIYGHGVRYLPRQIVARSDVFNEDRLSTYPSAYDFTLYIKSYDSYEGDGEFLSKFNIEIRDQITFSIARRSFERYITIRDGNITRPREGDIIYSSMLKRLMQIKHVNSRPVFYQMGALQMWDVTCEMFEYSNEVFNTGIDEIDSIQTRFSIDGVTANVDYEDAMSDVFADNQEFEESGNNLIDWTETDPFSEGNI